jgi:hypothetical protein
MSEEIVSLIFQQEDGDGRVTRRLYTKAYGVTSQNTVILEVYKP